MNKGVQKGNQVRTYAELNVGREVLDTLVLEQRALDERRGDDALLAAQATEKGVGELGTSVRHGERSRTSTVLRLDDLITTELDAVNELLVGLALDSLAVGDLGEKRDDGGTRVTADDGDVAFLGLDTGDAGEEAGGADDIEGGDTEQTLGVVLACLLQDFGSDGDGGVDGVWYRKIWVKFTEASYFVRTWVHTL